MPRPNGVMNFSVSNYDLPSGRLAQSCFGLSKQVIRANLKHSCFAQADKINRALGHVLPGRFANNMYDYPQPVGHQRVKSASRPTVMLVGPMPPSKGGVTTFMQNLMASPLNVEFEFVPFTTSRPPKKNVSENWGYRAVLRGGIGRIVRGALVTLWPLLKFPFAVIGGRIDLVQIQASDYQVFWEAALYAAMARILRRPVLFRIGGAFDIFHGGASSIERRLIAAVLRLPDVVIAQSVFASNYVRAAGRIGEIVLLPNWMHEIDSAAPPRPPATRPTCLFIIGQEARRKGTEEVLGAIGQLKERGCEVDFQMIAVPQSLQKRIADSGIAGAVRMEGPMEHRQVLAWMQRCEIFLLPSHGEGFPNSLVEAMAAGMACIATPVGAVPEMAAEGGVLIVPVGNAPALANAISQLVASAELRSRLGVQARQTVSAHYVASAALPKLAQAYRKLLFPADQMSVARH
jgi:glycosyltransferase involved in cell wall biosynthesis